MRHVLVALLLALIAPLAAAGSADAPEVVDAAGDATCVGSAGNEWADLDAAWISGETETSFDVNMRLAKWTDEHLASMTGFTVQFTHQGTQFGVAAIYFPPPMGDGWTFENGYIDLETQELSDFSDSTGTFTPGPPAILTVRFDKGHFPHVDANDTRLVDFKGGSADLKNQAPGFLLPVPPQPFEVCDLIESGAVYEFQTGDHTMHAPAAEDDAPAATPDAAPQDDAAPVAAAAAPDDEARDTPGPAVGLAITGAVVVALAMRRRG